MVVWSSAVASCTLVVSWQHTGELQVSNGSAIWEKVNTESEDDWMSLWIMHLRIDVINKFETLGGKTYRTILINILNQNNGCFIKYKIELLSNAAGSTIYIYMQSFSFKIDNMKRPIVQWSQHLIKVQIHLKGEFCMFMPRMLQNSPLRSWESLCVDCKKLAVFWQLDKGIIQTLHVVLETNMEYCLVMLQADDL